MVEKITLKRVRDSQELILDMMSTPDYILKSVDWGVVKGTHHSYKYINQIGVSITGTTLETREPVIEGWIVAQNEKRMTTLKRKLNQFVNPQEAIDLFYNDYVIRFIPNQSVRYSISAGENNEVFCKFQINGVCPNPLFSNTQEQSIPFAATIPMFHFPLVIPEEGIVFGRRTESLFANVINEGAVSVGMRIVFKANGSVINPSLTNVNTQEEFFINKTLVAGEEIEINTSVGEKSVRGKIGTNDFENYFMYKDIDSPWLQLDVGDNIFRYNAEEGIDNLDVYVYFNNKFLEVQECY